MDIKQRVNQEVPEIIENMKALVSYPSIMGKAEDGAPFGKPVRECLDKALEIMDGYGFETHNLDGYAGYAQVGKGDKVVGMVGHLDVVPVSDGWSSDPFELIVTEDKLIGRGSTDDKGPVCCAMAALKIVNEIIEDYPARIRLVFGCNEESGSLGLMHYVKEEGSFDYGFTPDGDFPGINGEKGFLLADGFVPTENILSVKAGSAHNVVPGLTTIKVNNDTFDIDLFKQTLTNNNTKCEVIVEDITTIKVFGVMAHASTPDLGNNSILQAFNALYEAGFKDPSVEFFHEKFKVTNHGEHIGLDLSDEFGPLTLNVGMMDQKDQTIHFVIDIRFPVTMHVKDIEEKLVSNIESFHNAKCNVVESEEPLFYEPDCELVQSLYQSYVEVTGDTEHKPMVIGGGTYAKAIDNTIAFGAEFPNDPDIHMHGDDEFMPIENVAKQTEIYVKALLNLLKLV